MPPLPIADWQAALAEMEAALAATLAALERLPPADATPGPVPPATEGPDELVDRLERRLRAWDARLGAAAGVTTTVERELADREAAIARWQELFTRWHQVIQQEVEPGSGGKEKKFNPKDTEGTEKTKHHD
jgi:hypothetical protein